MRISDWSSDVCSSDLVVDDVHHSARAGVYQQHIIIMTHPPIGTTSDGEPVTPRIGNHITLRIIAWLNPVAGAKGMIALRSEEHTSELQSLMRISYAVLCMKTNNHVIYYLMYKNITYLE